MAMTDTAFIDCGDFYLRELRASDLEGNWYNWLNDSEAMAHFNQGIFPNTPEKQKTYFDSLQKSKNDVLFAVVDKTTRQHIGNVGLHHIDWVHRSASVGILIGEKEFWGRGYGKLAWKRITEYGFNVLNLHRIWALVMTQNLASIKCVESAGFQREGEIRDMFYKDGKYESAYYYNFVRSDQA